MEPADDALEGEEEADDTVVDAAAGPQRHHCLRRGFSGSGAGVPAFLFAIIAVVLAVLSWVLVPVVA